MPNPDCRWVLVVGRGGNNGATKRDNTRLALGEFIAADRSIIVFNLDVDAWEK